MDPTSDYDESKRFKTEDSVEWIPRPSVDENDDDGDGTNPPAVTGRYIFMFSMNLDTPDTTKFVPCDGRCPGACGNDGSFYKPHDRFEDKQRDKQEFPTFTRKVPPIGVKYDEFDEDPELAKIKALPCRFLSLFHFFCNLSFSIHCRTVQHH